jgi:Protein of unknown function (DUF1592)/Protein of unknown function (DUF1588)/Protein of unknown function (DUF1595)/Protein of unknown function (DUF1587)/Protein of unknown function (DUF1585)
MAAMREHTSLAERMLQIEQVVTRLRPLASAALLAALQVSCTSPVNGGNGLNGSGADGPATTSGGGTSATGAQGGNGTGGAIGVSGNVSTACVTPNVGDAPLRRLTSREYDNAVGDLLGDTTKPAVTDFPEDSRVGIFDNTASAQDVPSLLAEKYLDTAAALAGGADVAKLVGCDLTGGGASACVSGFIQRFGRRAYRRPLAAEEVTSLQAIWSSTTAASDAQMGIRGVIAAVLASPHFLFRPEFGAEASSIGGAKKASAFELASRLAGLLWSGIPDELLLDAAAKGELSTPEQIAAQAQRLLADPRGRAATGAFYEQWLGAQLLTTATKDATLYPEFDDVLRSSLREETRRFIDNVIWDGDARVQTLFTASYSFVNARLARHYGVQGPADDATFMRVSFDATQRAGFLTQGSVLTALASPTESSPFKRGAWVRRRLLCTDLPNPPDNVPALPAPEPGVSLRVRASTHSSVQPCKACHQLIDGLGFGLEQYDSLGRFRTMEQGQPLDSSGEVAFTEDSDGAFNGGVELSKRLSESAQAQRCVATQWLRYSLARDETEADACSLAKVQADFLAAGGDLKKLMVALTQTDDFLNYRAPAEK